MKQYQGNTILQRINLNKDKGGSINLELPELSKQSVEVLRDMHGINCFISLSPLDCDAPEIQRNVGEIRKKSQSKRIRDKIYVLSKARNEEFETFYIEETNRILKYLDEKIDREQGL